MHIIAHDARASLLRDYYTSAKILLIPLDRQIPRRLQMWIVIKHLKSDLTDSTYIKYHTL